MSKSNTLETQYLTALFDSTTLTNLGSITLTDDLYIALYRSNPTDADSGTEANYTGYTRASVARGSGFSVSGNTATNTNAVIYPQATGGTNTITHFGVRTAATGGTLLYYGALTSSLEVVADVIPAFQAGTLTITED